MSTLKTTKREARIDFRLSREHKRMIEQAATAAGQSVSDFAVTALVRAARETMDQATVTRLSQRDRDTFLKLIASDAEPNEALKAAARQYRRRRA